MDKLVIQAQTVGPVKNPNCKFTFVQLVKPLVLLPFFSVKTAADYADSALGKLFFYKKGNGSWNALITTDMGIDAKRTFELYARRWCIEVAHKEMKGLLNLGKCQCVDFAGQIAALSLCMIQYNILGTVMRFESYETIGSLFTELTGETVELTVIQRIWGLIIKVINVIAEFISCDPFELTENVINNNHQIKAVKWLSTG